VGVKLGAARLVLRQLESKTAAGARMSSASKPSLRMVTSNGPDLSGLRDLKGLNPH